jgi:predicted nucleic acid-binding protein
MPVSVVDASALAALAFSEAEAIAVSDMLSGKRLVAPALVIYELGNTCWKKCRRYPSSAGAFRKSFIAALAMQIELFDVEPVEVLATAEDTGVSFYDAAYVWLARSLDARLVTLDRRLQQMAGTDLPG